MDSLFCEWPVSEDIRNFIFVKPYFAQRFRKQCGLIIVVAITQQLEKYGEDVLVHLLSDRSVSLLLLQRNTAAAIASCRHVYV